MAPSMFTSRQLLRLEILFIAAILGSISIFTNWWVFRATNEEESSFFFYARPFDESHWFYDEGFGEDLRGEVVVTGILLSLAVVATFRFFAQELLAALGRPRARTNPLIAAGMSPILGLSAVLYSTFAWPYAMGADVTFFRRFPESEVYAGLGWYLGILGLIVLPIVAIVLSYPKLSAERMELPPATRRPKAE